MIKDLIMNQPFTNAQLEVLKLFQLELSEIELKELKRVLAKFVAAKAIKEADKLWDEKELNDGFVNEVLSNKYRKKSD